MGLEGSGGAAVAQRGYNVESVFCCPVECSQIIRHARVPFQQLSVRTVGKEHRGRTNTGKDDVVRLMVPSSGRRRQMQTRCQNFEHQHESGERVAKTILATHSASDNDLESNLAKFGEFIQSSDKDCNAYAKRQDRQVRSRYRDLF